MYKGQNVYNKSSIDEKKKERKAKKSDLHLFLLRS